MEQEKEEKSTDIKVLSAVELILGVLNTLDFASRIHVIEFVDNRVRVGFWKAP